MDCLDKVLITSGLEFKNGLYSEIIDFAHMKTKNEIIAETIHRQCPIGVSVKGKSIVLGGEDFDGGVFQDGFIFQEPFRKVQMLEPREGAACVVINGDTIWIAGGNIGEEALQSTEYLYLDSHNLCSVQGPDLPFPIDGHSMIQISPSCIYVIGGFIKGWPSKKTWMIDPTDHFFMREGPSLLENRLCYSCAKMVLDGRVVIVVAGGIGKDSIELLDPLSDEGWVPGNTDLEINVTHLERDHQFD